jgi:peroxiredoxin
MVPWRMVSLLQHDLLYLQEQLPNIIQLKGASLLVLTPELPDRSISTTEKQLQFEVLSDVGNKVAKQYGIVLID